MAAVTRGLLSSCTLPWWRRTSRVWLTSRSLLINEYWNNTLISQSSFPEFGSLRGSRAAKPANDSLLTTNSFCNWNIGIPLIRTAIHQRCLLIKGFTLRSMGRKQQNSAERRRWAHTVPPHPCRKKAAVWMAASIPTGWNNFLWTMRSWDTIMSVKWLPWISSIGLSARMQGCLEARPKK